MKPRNLSLAIFSPQNWRKRAREYVLEEPPAKKKHKEQQEAQLEKISENEKLIRDEELGPKQMQILFTTAISP